MEWSIPWAATAVAFAANFVVGGAWYGALGKPWMREVGLDAETIRGGGWPMPAYLVAAVGAALQSLGLALVLGWIRPEGLAAHLIVAAVLGVAAAFATGKHHAFSRKTWTLFAIDGGNDLVGFLAMGLAFGLI